MRILLCSHWFFPSYGGVETVSRILAEEFVKAGASVTVVTKTPGANIDAPYQVVRRPSFDAVRKLGNQSDVIFQSLDLVARHLVPLSLTRKPVVIAHHSWMRRPDEPKERKPTSSYSPSAPVTTCPSAAPSQMPYPSIHPNRQPIRRHGIPRPPHIPKEKDIVFMGRLVSDKGVDLLLHAPRGPPDGRPHTVSYHNRRWPREADAGELDHTNGPRATGHVPRIHPGRQGRIVAQHRIMAIPSLWDQPFGVVALEGISSGCALVASSGGGLGEAVGPCGLLFPNGDRLALTSALRRFSKSRHFVTNSSPTALAISRLFSPRISPKST